MSNQAISDILLYFSNYFMQNDKLGLMAIIRTLGWWILLGLRWLTDAMQDLVDSAYSLIGIVNGTAAVEYMGKLKAILALLGGAALIILGFKYMLKRKNRPTGVLGNIALAVALVTVIPLAMATANDVLAASREYFGAGAGNSNADNVIISGMTDLKYLEANNWYYDANTRQFIDVTNEERISPTINLDHLNVNEVVNGDWGSLWRKTVSINAEGLSELSDMSETKILGVTIIPPESYFRFSFDFLTPCITLLATIIALFFACWKIVRIIFEILQDQIFATFLAWSDFSDGQRAKKFVMGIVNSYLVLLFITIILQLFFVFQNYITSLDSLNGLTKAFFIMLAAVGVIDGPNLIERVFGIDAGLSRSAIGTLANIGRVVHSASALRKGIKDSVQSAEKKAGTFVGKFAGRMDSEREARQRIGHEEKVKPQKRADDQNKSKNSSFAEQERSREQEIAPHTDSHQPDRTAAQDENRTANSDSRISSQQEDKIFSADAENSRADIHQPDRTVAQDENRTANPDGRVSSQHEENATADTEKSHVGNQPDRTAKPDGNSAVNSEKSYVGDQPNRTAVPTGNKATSPDGHNSQQGKKASVNGEKSRVGNQPERTTVPAGNNLANPDGRVSSQQGEKYSANSEKSRVGNQSDRTDASTENKAIAPDTENSFAEQEWNNEKRSARVNGDNSTDAANSDNEQFTQPTHAAWSEESSATEPSDRNAPEQQRSDKNKQPEHERFAKSSMSNMSNQELQQYLNRAQDRVRENRPSHAPAAFQKGMETGRAMGYAKAEYRKDKNERNEIQREIKRRERVGKDDKK